MDQEMPVRISVANIVPYISIKEPEETVAIGIADKKKYAKGVRQYKACGGGSRVSQEGKEMLEKKFSAIFLGKRKDANDARFITQERYVSEVLGLFENADSDFCEMNPLREIKEEFVDAGIAEQNDFEEIEYQHILTFYQKPAKDGVGTSINASKNIPTRRLFYVHKLSVPYEFFLKIANSKLITFFSERQLDLTKSGQSSVRLNNRTIMADNLCNYVPGLISK